MNRVSVLLLCVLASCVLATNFVSELKRSHANRSLAPRGQCLTAVCATSGQSCAIEIDTLTLPFCTQTGSLYCNQTTERCQVEFATGQSCSTGDQCLSSYCNSDDVCAEQQPVGGNCANDDDCENDNCVSGKCTYATAGQSCSDDVQCSPSLYCGTSDTCATRVATGGVCPLDYEACTAADTCQPSSATNTETGVCKQIHSAAAGALCYSLDDCGDNLGCNNSNSNPIGTCVSWPASSRIACDEDSDCGEFETCGCNLATGQQFCLAPLNNPAGTAALFQALGKCFAGACVDDQSLQCAATKCTSAYCSVYMSYSTIVQSGLVGYPQCFVDFVVGDLVAEVNSYSSACTTAETIGTTSDAASVAAASAFVVTAAALALAL